MNGDDVSEIEKDTSGWDEAGDMVNGPGGGAREALELLSKALTSALENIPENEESANE